VKNTSKMRWVRKNNEYFITHLNRIRRKKYRKTENVRKENNEEKT